MTPPSKPATITFPANRLGALISTPGGIPTRQAVLRAAHNVEELRPASGPEIEATITEIEAVLDACSQTAEGLTDSDLEAFIALTEHVLTASGTFGFTQVDQVAKSFCDLITLLRSQKIYDLDAIRINVHALRLCAPGTSLTPEAQQTVIAELQRLRRHYAGLHQPPSGCEKSD